MSTYEFDPDVCRQVLQKVAEDMPSGLSDPDLDEELVRFINESVTSSIKQKIDWLWGKYGIPEKLKQLKQLEKKSKKGDAWRPTTGEVDLDPIRVAKLETLKKELRKEIAEVKEESAAITPFLEKNFENCTRQLKEIDAIESKVIGDEKRDNPFPFPSVY